MTEANPGPEPHRALTAVVVGARRVRHGTGPFLARMLHGAGVRVVGVVGSTSSSAREAAEDLEPHGIRAQACTTPEEVFVELRPDLLVVASPYPSHRAWLLEAMEAGVHVLCEKPLWAGPAETTRELVRGFAARGLVLAENCQWPETLPAFRALHPGVDPAAASTFRMLLAPPLRGVERWAEVLSHPLSLLQAVLPGPFELEEVRFQEVSPDAPDSRLGFTWRAADRELCCEVVLEDLGRFPRPAEYAFDEFVCRRVVDPETYRMEFVSGDGPEHLPVPLGDPTETRLRRFLRRVEEVRATGSAPLDEDLVRRQTWLDVLLGHYRRQAQRT